MESPEKIKENMSNFIGTESYHNIGYKDLVLSDGAKYISDSCECYWLLDIINSYQFKIFMGQYGDDVRYMQFWKLKKIKNNKWIVTCDDGNGNIKITQKIDFSDFPLDEINLWVSMGNVKIKDRLKTVYVVYLPSEH